MSIRDLLKFLKSPKSLFFETSGLDSGAKGEVQMV